MTIGSDIVQSYRTPRAVLRRKLADGPREDRALAHAMAACAIVFVSTLPRLAREAQFDPSIPLDARIGGALFAWLILAPLALYLLAAVTHVLARLVGGRGGWFPARMALFWALLAAAPLWLLNGLAAGLLAPDSSGRQLIALLAFGGFLWLWSVCLSEAERPRPEEASR